MIGYILLGISVGFMIGITCFFAGAKYGVNKTYKILFDKIFDVWKKSVRCL